MNHFVRDLYTAQLALLFTKPSDFWELWDLWDGSAIGRQMLECGTPTLAMAIEHFEALAAGGSGEAGIWLLKTTDGTRPIGCASMIPDTRFGSRTSTPPDTLKLRLALLPAVSGRSYAQEAARALIRHAFSRLHIRHINANELADDPYLRPLLRRLGLCRTNLGTEANGGGPSHILSR